VPYHPWLVDRCENQAAQEPRAKTFLLSLLKDQLDGPGPQLRGIILVLHHVPRSVQTLPSGRVRFRQATSLFRGGAEARIRTKLLKDGHIDTVIGLPANLFFSTGIPVCILVLKKCKKPDDVLFINAAEHFEKGKRQNQLLPEHIDKIIDTYRFRQEEARYSRRVGMAEIEKNDFNLNISRYVSTAVAEQAIDLGAVHAELVSLDRNIAAATRGHNAFLKELGLPSLP